MSILDLDAPIVPGQSAGGYHIGQAIGDILRTGINHLSQEIIRDTRGKPSGSSVYRSETVDLWVHDDGLIRQIGLHGAYRGKLFGRIVLGMTIDDLERLVGPCYEDDEDCLRIFGIPGLCFETTWSRTSTTPDVLDFNGPGLRFSPVTWFFVYAEA